MYTWEEIENYVNNCRRCPLCETRKRAVMGRGSHQAQIMFIAEAPGEKENQAGIPFIGPAGQLFDKLLKGCGLSREEIYITNILKCHPPYNREPKEEEKEKCFPYLCYETYLLKPRIIVCLGRVAAQRLIDPGFRITRQHGEWIERKGYYLTAIYHPSALLRDPDKLETTKEDFCKIVQKRDEINQN